MPWVFDCVSRHKKKKDFRKLLQSVGGLTSWEYFCAIRASDNAPIEKACENIAKEACQRIKNHDLHLPPVSMKEMVDKSSGKVRLIGRESAMQQVLDYIARYSCEEIWSKRIVPQQVSSIKGKGQVAGVQMIKKWIATENKCADYHKRYKLKTYHKRTQYFVKLDITKCFPSMRLETFLKFFNNDCANKDIIWLWTELLKSHRVNDYQGFMIGSLVSESAAQYLLSYLYNYSLSLHGNSRRGNKPAKKIYKALYFMDDQLYFSSNYRNLKSAIKDIIKFAKESLNINIKPNWQICNIDETPVDIMGYLIRADASLGLRKRVFIRSRRMAMRYKRTQQLNLTQARRISAYKGYYYPNFKHKQSIHIVTNSQMVKQKYQMKKMFNKAQNIISEEARKRKPLKNIIV